MGMSCAVPNRLTEHVLLFSIDGYRPQVYRDERWPAPVLHQLARQGAFALSVRSVFPALTYPAHVSLVTGALLARHGVVHTSRSSRRTLWDAIRARGGTTAAVSWPVTVGAAIDWNVPDVWDPANTAWSRPGRGAGACRSPQSSVFTGCERSADSCCPWRRSRVSTRSAAHDDGICRIG